ncbi:MAG: undecaprenyl-diphosphate phosphatase [Candidatus Saccharibacteria bacterium]|nr:undecaprenyl-diphosphate phosphatase [Candidatus Saccharibacteria bacterium]
MNPFESITLGLVQGLTEFIPVSSSGHLEVAQSILAGGARADDFHFFLELINFGTLLALLIFYRKRIWKIIKDIFINHNWRMAINLVLTSVPAGLIGLLLSDFIESAPFFSSLAVIGTAMGLVGILMILVDKLPHLSKIKSEEELTHPRAFAIGLAQTFALIPGVSRSGSTIIAGRITGMDSKSSADYSFLASIPIMLAVCGKSLISSSSRAYIMDNLGMLALSNIVAFASGLIALTIVMKYLKKKNSLQAFGIYRVIVSLGILIYVLFTV